MNITLAIDDAVVERARDLAARQGTTLNEMVRRYLVGVVGGGESATAAEELRRLLEERPGNSGGWKFNRDELYEERVGTRS